VLWFQFKHVLSLLTRTFHYSPGTAVSTPWLTVRPTIHSSLFLFFLMPTYVYYSCILANQGHSSLGFSFVFLQDLSHPSHGCAPCCVIPSRMSTQVNVITILIQHLTKCHVLVVIWRHLEVITAIQTFNFFYPQRTLFPWCLYVRTILWPCEYPSYVFC